MRHLWQVRVEEPETGTGQKEGYRWVSVKHHCRHVHTAKAVNATLNYGPNGHFQLRLKKNLY